MKRSEARELAFVLLFEASFQPEKNLKEIVFNAQQTRDLELDEFAVRLADTALEKREQLDELIGRHSQNWKAERLSRVAVALLRLALCEMQFMQDVPVGVAINEAVELAKKYGGEEEAGFINGVLGAVARNSQAPVN